MNAAELTDSLAEAWDALLHTPLFGIALTLAVAVLSRRLWLAARQTALLTPVLVTIVLTLVLRATKVDAGVDQTRWDDYAADVGDKGVAVEVDPHTPAHA